jgi:hypothetical protein
MPLIFGHSGRFALRFFWEQAPQGSPAGPAAEPLRLQDRGAVLACLGSIRSRPEEMAALRRFARDLSPGGPVRVDDPTLFDLVVRAVLSGRLHVIERPILPLSTFGDPEEEQPISAAPQVSAPPPAAEEVCWPCLRAAASSRALRSASAAGSPFIAEM